MHRTERVLIVTGSLVSQYESSWVSALRKLALQTRGCDAPWLDLKIKAVLAEPMVAAAQERLWPLAPEVGAFFSHNETKQMPELTEVVLATLLRARKMPYEAASYEELFASPALRERLLARATCVFASTTLLHDLSELKPIVALLKRKHNRVVLGGALAGILCQGWAGLPGVDLLAVGYGELLVSQIVAWMRSGYTELAAPEGGRLERSNGHAVLYSGVPPTRDLDFLVTPDWKQSSCDRGRRYSLISYESVRGCPYRCAFCNYPYLFDDTRFRFKSARKIVDDWQRYRSELGVEYISCLDSLFTLPRPRLRELCRLLIERKLGLKWVCYARGDDLADESLAAMMQEAGCHQVQIGIESGDQTVLDNMNKVCTVEQNRKALENCRALGLTSIVTLIIGYPGETERTLEATYRLMEAAPPDFHFLATFSTRVAGVPVLSPESKRRFGLHAMESLHTAAPYWAHATMSCADAGRHARALSRRLAENRVSLNAALFYRGILNYESSLRAPLLDFQHRLTTRHPLQRRAFDVLHGWLDRRLAADVDAWLSRELDRRGTGSELMVERQLFPETVETKALTEAP